MKNILNLDGVKKINKNVQKQIKGGSFFTPTYCEPSNPDQCCYDIPGRKFWGQASYCTPWGQCDFA